MACDCTYEGNTQVIGPKCQQRIHDDWAEAIRTAEHIELGEN